MKIFNIINTIELFSLTITLSQSSASSIVRRMSNQLQIPEVPEQEMDVDNEE
uniref:Uncharacterized protein n=1 Tax=Rhizophagus irregularis (strain DAOM 181602 / DAOM 197198 / MUCL 43194) TaxID=747089 RepID=U9T8I0_RHIID